MEANNEKGMQDRSKAFERHLKRHVLAPAHRFLVVVPQELERICRDELAAAGMTESTETEAGLEFEGRLDTAYRCNLMLRTASRVLLRLAPFRAGVPEELFFKVMQMRWELWLNPQIPMQIEAHVQESRIDSEGLAAEKVLAGIHRRFRDSGLIAAESGNDGRVDEAGGAQPKRQRILVHLIKNHCQISLDTTGAHLHERGYRTRHSGAPLRETLAAAILLKSGWDGRSPLVDGMCGAGTFAIEAALIARKIPPGMEREFLFQQWPSFRKSAWEHMRGAARNAILPRLPSPVRAVDLSEEAISIARRNGERAGVASDIDWTAGDFFEFAPMEYGLKGGVLMLNPPYGKRLSGGGKLFLNRLGTRIREHYRGWRYAIITPSRASAVSLNLPSVRFWSIRHGGLQVTVAMGRV